MKEITKIVSSGQGIKHSSGDERRCIYLAPHKIQKWWAREIGAIADIVRKSFSSVGGKLEPQAEIKLGDVLAHLGLPSASIGIKLSLNKESVTSETIKLKLSPYIKSVILERYTEDKKGFLTDWVTAKAAYVIRWDGKAEITELEQIEEANTIHVPDKSLSSFPYQGTPNELPLWSRKTSLENAIKLKLKHYKSNLPFIIWLEQGNHKAITIMDRRYIHGIDPNDYIGNLHRYISLMKKHIVYIGEATEWVDDVRFMNPYVVWLSFS